MARHDSDRDGAILQIVATILLAGVVAGLAVQAGDVLINRSELRDTGLSVWQWVFVERWNYDVIVALGALGVLLVGERVGPLLRLDAILGVIPACWLLTEAIVVVATGEAGGSWPRLTSGLIVEVMIDLVLAGVLLIMCAALFTRRPDRAGMHE